MRDKVIEIIKTMRGQAAIDGAMGEKRCSFYLNDYANQLAMAVGSSCSSGEVFDAGSGDMVQCESESPSRAEKET